MDTERDGSLGFPEMVGGYVPSDDTPTHFLGRETTERACGPGRQSRLARRIAGSERSGPGRTRIERVRVAPGVIVAYRVPVAMSGSENALSKGNVPGGEDLVEPDMDMAPDMKMSEVDQANDGPMAEGTADARGIAGFSSRHRRADAEPFEGTDDEWSDWMHQNVDQPPAEDSTSETKEEHYRAFPNSRPSSARYVRRAQETIGEEREEDKEDQMEPALDAFPED